MSEQRPVMNEDSEPCSQHSTEPLISSLQAAASTGAAAPEDFVSRVEQQVRLRRRRRVAVRSCGCIALLAACFFLPRIWHSADPVHTVADGPAANEPHLPEPAGSDFSVAAQDTLQSQERWVSLSHDDVQRLSEGRVVDQLSQFEGRTVAVMPVLERDGNGLKIQWKATALDETTSHRRVLTTFDRELLQRSVRPPAKSLNNQIVL